MPPLSLPLSPNPFSRGIFRRTWRAGDAVRKRHRVPKMVEGRAGGCRAAAKGGPGRAVAGKKKTSLRSGKTHHQGIPQAGTMLRQCRDVVNRRGKGITLGRVGYITGGDRRQERFFTSPGMLQTGRRRHWRWGGGYDVQDRMREFSSVQVLSTAVASVYLWPRRPSDMEGLECGLGGMLDEGSLVVFCVRGGGTLD